MDDARNPIDRRRPAVDAVEAALDVCGDRWRFLLIREAFFGVRRFTDFRSNLGIARRVLAERLDEMVEQGLFERRRYCERPPRDEYRLTDAGRDLFTIVVAIMQWGERWVLHDRPLLLHHRPDGGAMRAVLVCDACEAPIEARDVEWVAAGGAVRHER